MRIINIIIIVLLIIVLHQNVKSFRCYKISNFVESNNPKYIKKKTSEILDHVNMFDPNIDYLKVKKKLKWLDPVTYHDTYKLKTGGKLTTKNLNNTFI
jgi:Fe-S oxidoreductase